LTLLEDRYEGSPFVEAYLEGGAGILGSIMVIGPLYFWRLRIALILAWSVGIFGGIWLIIFHMRWIPPTSWGVFMSEKSNATPGSEEEAEFYETDAIIFWIWWVKVCLNWAFACCYMESFCENNTFSFYKRVTGAGLSNFVARTLCVFTPMVGDLAAPIPDAISVGVMMVALIVAFFLPDREDEDDYTRNEGTGIGLNFPAMPGIPTGLGDLKGNVGDIGNAADIGSIGDQID